MSALKDDEEKVNSDVVEEVPTVPLRKQWDSKIEFFFTSLSYAVGLGNIWRFPYLCYTNGGGVFLIPYFTMLFFIGIPFYVLESALGQYSQTGPVNVWAMCPLFRGLGYSMFVIVMSVSIYYNMLIGWCVGFLYHSFTMTLPWTTCNNTWNTPTCRTTTQLLQLKKTTKPLTTFAPRLNVSEFWNVTTSHATAQATAQATSQATSQAMSQTMSQAVSQATSQATAQAVSQAASLITVAAKNVTYSTPSEEFFHLRILDLSAGIENLGSVSLMSAICLFICWTIVFLCLIRGVSSLGKVAYFTALFPYLVLTALVIRGLTLPGSLQGIIFYLKPDWHKLLEIQVWSKAAMQIFYSLSPSWGCLITISSFNNFHSNCVRDSVIIAVSNCLTSFYGGFAIFSVLGFMAHTKGVEVSTVVNSGAGLAFIAYPEAIGQLPFPPIWSFLFFSMLMTLGMGSQVSMVQSLITSILDVFPRFRPRTWLVLLCSCTFMFLLGLILCTRGGMYVLVIMDDYCASFSSLAVGLLEALVISYVYGANRFIDNLKEMLLEKTVYYSFWKFMFRLLPLFIFGIFVAALVAHSPSKYGTYDFPHWSTGLGFCLSSLSVLWIPGVAIYELTRYQGPFMQRIRAATASHLRKRAKEN